MAQGEQQQIPKASGPSPVRGMERKGVVPVPLIEALQQDQIVQR